MDLGFVDSHCHISAREFEEDLGDVIQRSRRAGVETLIAVTEEVGEFSRVLQLQQRYPDVVAPCFGLHPLQGGEGPEQRSAKPQDLDAALPLFYKHREHLVAVGEIGLDFTPWRAPTQQDRDDQMTVFVKQLDVAKELDLPVNVHSRSAAKVTIETMREQGISRALLHNFAGKPSVALEGVKAGYLFSFPPAVCRNQQKQEQKFFGVNQTTGSTLSVHAESETLCRAPLKTQRQLRSENSICGCERDKLIRAIPLEHICLETDSPALGLDKHGRNEPCNIVLSCRYIADVKGLSAQTVQLITAQNAYRLFPGADKQQRTHSS